MTDPTNRERQALIDALAEEARREAGPPVEPEVLLDYLRGRLAPEDRQRVERRIVGDPGTARQLLDLADLVEAEEEAARAEEEGDEEAADFALEAGWRDLRSRLAVEEERSVAEKERVTGAGQRWGAHGPPARRGWQIAAAVLLVVAGGLGLRTLDLQRDLRIASERPRRVVAGELVRVRSASTLELQVPAGAWLSLAIDPASACASYRVEIDGPRTEGPFELVPDDRGYLQFVLPVEVGEYSVAVSGCDETVEYPFRVERPPSGESPVEP